MQSAHTDALVSFLTTIHHFIGANAENLYGVPSLSPRATFIMWVMRQAQC